MWFTDLFKRKIEKETAETERLIERGRELEKEVLKTQAYLDSTPFRFENPEVDKLIEMFDKKFREKFQEES